MKRKELDNILRNLLVAGNIVTVPFEQMREIRKELDRFVKPVQPFQKIQNVKRNIQKLFHLFCMNRFVIVIAFTHRTSFSYEKNPKQIYTLVPLEWNYFVIYNFH